MNSKIKYFIMFLIILAWAGLIYYYFIAEKPVENIVVVDFLSCKNAGYPIMESYPMQCRTPDGRTFVEVINRTEDTAIANPASTYCIEKGGRLDIRTGSDGGQKGYCIFSNGVECDEWAFYRKECAKENVVMLGKDLVLGYGNVGKIKSVNMEIRLMDVLNDSRCPVESKCAALGEVNILAKASLGDKTGEIKINYIPDNKNDASSYFEGYKIRAVKVSPQNVPSGLKKEDYLITFIVSKDAKKIDYSCKTDSDCAVKNLGNLCGEYLNCVNINYEPQPPERESEICGSPGIDGCNCENGVCIGTLGGKLNVN